MALKPGSAVFLYDGSKRHHVGVFVGNDTVIEAKGTLYGVVTSSVSHWHEWGELKVVDYSDVKPEIVQAARPTLRQGATGESVEYMQQLLIQHGYTDVEADGIFGAVTLDNVKAFQSANGLTADGICGRLTWAALLTPPDEDDDETESDEDSQSAGDDARTELIRQLRQALTEHALIMDRMTQIIESIELKWEDE